MNVKIKNLLVNNPFWTIFLHCSSNFTSLQSCFVYLLRFCILPIAYYLRDFLSIDFIYVLVIKANNLSSSALTYSAYCNLYAFITNTWFMEFTNVGFLGYTNKTFHPNFLFAFYHTLRLTLYSYSKCVQYRTSCFSHWNKLQFLAETFWYNFVKFGYSKMSH